jgi:hypothetical protein
MADDHIKTLLKSRAKLVERRRAAARRDAMTDRDEGFAERIVAIQAALDATDRAIAEEQEFLLTQTQEAAA